jgi:hypothetical protein
MTIAKCSEIAGYDLKKLIDDRTILRRETGGTDFLPAPTSGRTICDRDDAAALILYAEMRGAGQPVKVAGITASRIRDGMRHFPEADQLTIVSFQNGLTITLPSADLDLRTGYNSGSYLSTALLVDCRNLRARVQRAR